MRYHRRHAADVSKPSACLLADSLTPHTTGEERERLVRYLEEHIRGAIYAYCAFHAVKSRPAIPTPSQN